MGAKAVNLPRQPPHAPCPRTPRPCAPPFRPRLFSYLARLS